MRVAMPTRIAPDPRKLTNRIMCMSDMMAALNAVAAARIIRTASRVRSAVLHCATDVARSIAEAKKIRFRSALVIDFEITQRDV